MIFPIPINIKGHRNEEQLESIFIQRSDDNGYPNVSNKLVLHKLQPQQ